MPDTKHEITQDQLDTIQAIAAEAVKIADISDPRGDSPLAAEIFRTLLRCHIDNRFERVEKDYRRLMDERLRAQASAFKGTGYGGQLCNAPAGSLPSIQGLAAIEEPQSPPRRTV